MLAVSHARVTLRNCAATYPGSEQFCVGLFNKRHVLWHATCIYLNRRLNRSGRQDL